MLAYASGNAMESIDHCSGTVRVLTVDEYLLILTVGAERICKDVL